MRRTNAQTFVDPEDSHIVADAKNVFTEPVPYTYTEVTWGAMSSVFLNLTYFIEGCHLIQSWDRGYRERAQMDL